MENYQPEFLENECAFCGELCEKEFCNNECKMAYKADNKDDND